MKEPLIVKKVITGVLVGLIATALGGAIWILALSDTDLISTIKNAYGQQKLGTILAAGALLNIGAFFLFIKQNKTYEARGVMVATLLIAVFGMIQKFG